MAFKIFALVLLAFLTLTTVPFRFVTGQSCSWTKLNTTAPKCANGTQEIYMEQQAKMFKRFCCSPKAKMFQEHKDNAEGCRPSPCTAAGTAAIQNMCTFNPRWVNGKRLDYQDTIRDECIPKGTDKPGGVKSLCCPANTTNILLATLATAERNEFPHFARITLGAEGCGGSTYNERYIITAGHCVKDKIGETVDPKVIKVRLNPYVSGGPFREDEPNVYGVEGILLHPQMSTKAEPRTHDVALLRLDKDVVFGEKIKALRIAPKGFNPTSYADEVVVIGYGTTDVPGRVFRLQKARLRIRNATTYFNNFKVNPRQTGVADQILLLGGFYDNIFSPSTGKGDAGSPAICRDNEGFAIHCGIASPGGGDPANCTKFRDEDTCSPSLFQQVQYFHDWIVENAGLQKTEQLLKVPLFGRAVPSKAYLHQVHVNSTKGPNCGGTLISEDLVLTAAQCVANENGSVRDGVQVGVGVRDLLANTAGVGELISAKRVTVHPGYSRVWTRKAREKRMVGVTLVKGQAGRVVKREFYFKNDIALIRLKRKAINITGDDGVATLPDPQFRLPPTATEVSFPTKTSRSGKLSQREFTLLNGAACSKRLRRLAANPGMAHQVSSLKYSEEAICAVEKFSGGTMCDRELGGGVMCGKRKGRDVVCGVQTFRLCETTIPTAFLNVTNFSEWIAETSKKMV